MGFHNIATVLQNFWYKCAYGAFKNHLVWCQKDTKRSSFFYEIGFQENARHVPFWKHFPIFFGESHLLRMVFHNIATVLRNFWYKCAYGVFENHLIWCQTKTQNAVLFLEIGFRENVRYAPSENIFEFFFRRKPSTKIGLSQNHNGVSRFSAEVCLRRL